MPSRRTRQQVKHQSVQLAKHNTELCRTVEAYRDVRKALNANIMRKATQAVERLNQNT